MYMERCSGGSGIVLKRHMHRDAISCMQLWVHRVHREAAGSGQSTNLVWTLINVHVENYVPSADLKLPMNHR